VTAHPWPRVRKARRSSVVACGHYVTTGQLIDNRGGRWTCLGCALETIRTGRTATMNLYAINATNAPHDEMTFLLAKSDEEALEHGVFVAAHDLVEPIYFSPSAEVYLVAKDVKLVGTAYAKDAPAAWKWAHPAVEDALDRQARDDAEFGLVP
jgi:hypothetical protein